LKKFSQNNLRAEYDVSKTPRVGLIALSTDFTIEQDFRNVFYNQPVNLYVNRIPFNNPMTQENYLKMRDILPSIVENILPGETINTIAYGCTSGTIAIGENVITKKINEVKKKCYVTTPITAALKAFKSLSLNKIAVLTPYPELVNKTIFNFLTTHNIEITSFSSYNIDSDLDVGRIRKETILKTIQSIDHSDADSIFISCTAMPVLNIIEDIENFVSKPVLSSNQVIIWDCLRSVKINSSISGYGQLFKLH